MKLYITYTKNSFTNEQIRILQQVGEVIFLEKVFELDKAPYFENNDEKILVVDPDWYNWDINSNHLSKVKNLKAVCLSTTAYDWIDLKYCKESNIIVCNIPKYSTDSVAEYAIFLMMCLAKKFPLQLKKDYKMEYSIPMLTTEIRNKTVGIIGLGTIGTKIAEEEKISYAFEIYDDGKKMYDYKGNIMATAPYAFYTKEAIERLVAIWCKNVIQVVNNHPQNVIE